MIARRIISGLWSTATVGLILGCTDATAPDATATDSGPAAEFSSLEQRMLAANEIAFDFHVTAEGAVGADLKGRLDIGPGAGARLVASGTFDGQPVELALRSDENQLEMANGARVTRTATPAQLKEALVIGVTRMGILHNLARLTGGLAPDHAEGGVRDWVTVGAFAPGANGIGFDLTVAGEPAGSAMLEIDAGGRPAIRRQTVDFPTGQMHVVERYSAVAMTR